MGSMTPQMGKLSAGPGGLFSELVPKLQMHNCQKSSILLKLLHRTEGMREHKDMVF